MKRSKKVLGLAGAVAIALSFLAPSAAYAQEVAPTVTPTGGSTALDDADIPNESSPSQEVGEEYIDTSESDGLFGNTVDSSNDPSSLQLQSTRFTGRVQAHNPHKSHGQTSGHVSWYITSGTNRKVKVTSTLKARTSWVTFKTKAGPTAKSVYAGGGGGKDAVARYTCKNSKKRDWYTYGAAYAPGTSKPFGSHSSAVKSVACDGGLQ
ncbi:MAG: hypothetical protein ACTHWM_03835 [Yaniella sp.]|uniref:hypothetical protein n=1 Tax=Yaniella sp. TaxID=2773929 RepID=UPI003F9A43F1